MHLGMAGMVRDSSNAWAFSETRGGTWRGCIRLTR
jgi:hypothetical protein